MKEDNEKLQEQIKQKDETIHEYKTKIEEYECKINELEKNISSYTTKIVDYDVEKQKSQDLLRSMSLMISEQREKIEKYESDIKFVKEKANENFLQKMFDLINTIKIFKNKIDKDFLKYVSMLEKQVTKNLPVYGVEMKEVFIGDSYNELEDSLKELCEVTEIEDEELQNGYIKDVISNAFLKGENVLSFAKIFVVNNG
jgi:molecular chaperone GrpE (heat shock protein)